MNEPEINLPNPPRSFDDIDAIREYIAEDNPNAAKRMITEIFVAIRSLVSFPNQGYRRPNLTTRPLRFKLVKDELGVTVTDGVRALGVARSALSRIINRRAGVSAEMALRLEKVERPG